MSPLHVTRRLVLEDKPLDDVTRVFSGAGYPLVVDIDEPERRGFHRQRAWEVIEGVRVFYVEDSLSQCAFVYTEGSDKETTEGMEPLLETQFRTVSLDRLLSDLPDPATATERDNQKILRAGLGAPNACDPAFLGTFTRLLRSPEPQVRLATAWALSYSAWPEALPVVREAMAMETDTDVLSVLGALREGLVEKR
ncbi:HEAT repeat domain-containing protein [Streptomyces ficellus]|uniref:HEAT repeat domain-containing protein n=1 Tax=Streptomyces ficellus TaxID=1977088 RepID=A0ABT7YZT0_9ACTN|nr:HEAT repeat domain-containing protein [Streptomyces ficellus]MDN3292742.1 HEAT repeat domain-containing protein [Streptomyces ficellus]